MKHGILVVLFLTLSCGWIAAQDSTRSKIAPNLKAAKSVRVVVKNKVTFQNWMRQNFPDVSIKVLPSDVFEIPIHNIDDIKKIQGSGSVIFIDRSNRTPKEERALSGFDFSLNNIVAVQSAYPALTGEDIVVSIKEKPFDQTDIDIKNRIVLSSQFDEPSTAHATIMATIVAGAGNSEPTGKGVASAAKVTTSDFLQLSPDDGTALTSLGVSVQNHSYGVGVENYYGIESAQYDEHCQDFPTIVHVFSSGNEGDKADATGTYSGIAGFANLTGQFKNSKNTISVGSLNAFGVIGPRSSRGPAQDGRVKPEITAFGDAGSSESAAFVSGIAALIQQSYKNQNGVLPASSLVKAILINSADDVGRAEVDFETGFGNVDALGAVRTVESDRFISGSISDGIQNEHLIEVPAGTHLLKVTLVWNDKEALPSASKALVNDLDLVLIHVPSGDSWKPWTLSHYPHSDSLTKVAKRKADHLNPVEQITVRNPAEGSYALRVTGFDVQPGTQSYSLAYEFESGFEWTNPVEGTSFAAGSNSIIRWRWTEDPIDAVLEYRYAGQSNWIEIADNIEMAKGFVTWTLPDTSALVQLRLNGNESEVFPISKPINLQVGYNCEDEVLLRWNKIQNADQYQLYRLGERYLDPFRVTVDTFVILNESEKNFLFYAAAPSIQGITGINGATENYTLQGTACYVTSFLPRQFVVTDDAVFDVTIGTYYGLDSLTLERLNGDQFETVQTIKPVLNENHVFTDANPERGTNFYRVRVSRSNGEFDYSETEQIIFPRKRDLFIYPNPVRQGELSSIVLADPLPLKINIYDFMGRLIASGADDGEVKTIDTSTLKKGAYVVEAITSNGSKLIGKLIVW